jgi:hypothetical protein
MRIAIGQAVFWKPTVFFIEKRHRPRWVAVNTNAAAERKDKAPTPEPIAGIKTESL